MLLLLKVEWLNVLEAENMSEVVVKSPKPSQGLLKKERCEPQIWTKVVGFLHPHYSRVYIPRHCCMGTEITPFCQYIMYTLTRPVVMDGTFFGS